MTIRYILETDKDVTMKKNQIIRDGILDFNARYIGERPEAFSIYAEDDLGNVVGRGPRVGNDIIQFHDGGGNLGKLQFVSRDLRLDVGDNFRLNGCRHFILDDRWQ